MKTLKAATIFGTRPEAIKMAPLVLEMQKHDCVEPIVCVTAQHREMLDQVLDLFKIHTDYDLNIMKDKQSLSDITMRALEGLMRVLGHAKPDVVLVHGDTTTTFAGSLAAFYSKIPCAHVEAGLRTYNKYFPYPEEMNRKLTGVLSDLHFAPTKNNKANLLKEGVNKDKIYVTGNTVIDALKTTVEKGYIFQNKSLGKVDFTQKKVILVTAHRRENLGKPLEHICEAIKYIADLCKDVLFIYSVHLNPQVQGTAKRILGNHEGILLTEPLDPQDMHNLQNKSYMIMTDSGGLQEEAPSLGKPVLVLRNETERPEALEAGTVKLAGTNKENIIHLALGLLGSEEEYNKMAKAVNPYGDGRASERIVQALLYEFGLNSEKPEQF